mmetsp:Transcript_13314/g.25256  ORF Transcript_13314/g.25256 Transcript_13314/m.25256 type:complete len:211 (-) Transcript_13314:1372-2004(-)
MNRHSTFGQYTNDGVPGLVKGSVTRRLLGNDGGLAFRTHENFVFGVFHDVHVNGTQSIDRSLDSSLVNEIAQISTRHSSGSPRHDIQVDIGSQLGLFGIHFENGLSSADIGQGHYYVLVETSRTQQCRIERFDKVGGTNDDNTIIGIKAIHLHQQFVQGHFKRRLILEFARATYGINFVDKDNGTLFLFGRFEQFTNSLGTQTNVNFFKL